MGSEMCIRDRVGTLPEVTADLTGRLRDQVRRGLPESNIITQLGGSLREVEDTWRVTKEAIAGIVPEYWLGLGAEGDLVLTPPEADMLAAYDAVTTNSSKTQQKLGMLDNQGRHAARTASLEQLLEKERPPGPGDPLGGARPTPSPRLAIGAYKGQEPLHAFGRVQQTRSVS